MPSAGRTGSAAVGPQDSLERQCLGTGCGEAALEDEEYRRRAERWGRAEREELAGWLRQVGAVDVFPSETNFLLLRLRAAKGRRGFGPAAGAMGRRGILIRDASTFPGLDDRYVRIAVRTRRENERLIAALRKVWAEWGGGGEG